MPFDATVAREDGFLRIGLSGELLITDLSGSALDGLGLDRRAAGLRRVLIDARELSVKLDVAGEFMAAEQVPQIIPPGVRLGVLGATDRISPQGFFEMVAQNRGVDVRVFPELDAALDWLGAGL